VLLVTVNYPNICSSKIRKKHFFSVVFLLAGFGSCVILLPEPVAVKPYPVNAQNKMPDAF